MLAQPSTSSAPWTLADVERGAITPAPGMSAQDAVNFFNRYHPRQPIVPVSQVLTSAPEPDLAACTPLPNPYTESDRARACILASMALDPLPDLPIFDVGRRYTHAYPDRGQMIVLSVTRSLEGQTVVTAQMIAGPENGGVFAFAVTAEAGVWQAVAR